MGVDDGLGANVQGEKEARSEWWSAPPPHITKRKENYGEAMKGRSLQVMLVGGVFLFLGGMVKVTVVQGAELMVFPAKGQTEQQRSADMAACHQWAVTESGVDPSRVSAPAPSGQQQGQRQVLRGALAGAAVGGLGGSLGGEFGKGAAAGAAVGAAAGGIRRHQQKQATASVEQQQQQLVQEQLNRFNRAYSACLEGKGYTVK